MTDKDEHRPIIAGRTKLSDTTDQLNMSDGSVMYACRWPGCRWSGQNRESIPAHYKSHSGKAAQRRRGERRIKADESLDNLLDVLVSINDRSKDGMDLIDAMTDRVLDLTKQVEAYKAKAEKWDRLMADMHDEP